MLLLSYLGTLGCCKLQQVTSDTAGTCRTSDVVLLFSCCCIRRTDHVRVLLCCTCQRPASGLLCCSTMHARQTVHSSSTIYARQHDTNSQQFGLLRTTYSSPPPRRSCDPPVFLLLRDEPINNMLLRVEQNYTRYLVF